MALLAPALPWRKRLSSAVWIAPMWNGSLPVTMRPKSPTVATIPACVSLVTGCAHASPQPTMPSSVEILTKTFSLYCMLANYVSRAWTMVRFFFLDPNRA